ncbi:phage portal protein [Nitrospirillum amazonense]|uniref:phage portal protein n=1 Tax=Nitrospirillum amazonense TaxID=28077 RepID=UPI002DD441B5|nr:phage portal protein [Nitrospirillum amazonense]MEC4591621.1 phage portal protein [Nitrospirillum amazonense]
MASDREKKGTAVPQGMIARAAKALGAAVSYTVTGDASAWFGPLDPLPPTAQEVAGRQFDFPSGYNLLQRPKAYEGTRFEALRALADSWDLLRLLIETRKDQMAGLAWNIRPRDQKEGATTTEPDARTKALVAFFRRPDGVHAWSRWLRLLLEDLMVIDAPTLYVARTLGGQARALQVMDGATIKRVIDPFGRTPLPPAVAYQQELKGLPAVDYTTDDLIYAPRNPRPHRVYGLSPVEQIETTVNLALRRQIWQLQYYTEGNIPEALIGVPDTWNPDQIRQFQSYWDVLHEGDTASRRHAKFVPGGVAKTFIPIKEPELKGVFDEWLARVACFAFSVSPQPFVKEMNRATSENASDTAREEGLAPTKQWVKELIDDVLVREFGAADLEFAWSDDKEVDPVKAAEIANIHVRAGIKTLNEVRADIGYPPVKGGDVPLIYTAGGAVPLDTAIAQAQASVEATQAMGRPQAQDDQRQAAGGQENADDQAPGAKALGKRAPVTADEETDQDEVRGPDVEQDHQLRDLAVELAALLLSLYDRWRVRLLLFLPDAMNNAIGPGLLPGMGVDRAGGVVADAWAKAGADIDLGAAATGIQNILNRVVDEAVAGMVGRLGVTEADVRGAVQAAQAQALNRAAEMLGITVTAGVVHAAPDAQRVVLDTVKAQLEKAVADQLEAAAQAMAERSADSATPSEQKPDATAMAAGAVSAVTALTRDHTDLIGLTEVVGAANVAADAVAQAVGFVVGSRWVTSALENTCAICRLNEAAGVVPLGQRFPSGDFAPGAHPNCVCSRLFVLQRSAGPLGVGALSPFDVGKGYNPGQPRDSHGRWAPTGDLAEFLRGGLSGTRVVARLPADIQRHLGAKSARVLLSAETVATHGHHGWTASEFGHLQGVLDRGEVRADRANHAVVAHLDGQWWYAAVKVTNTRDAVYLSSFHRMRESSLAAFRKHQLIRG